MAVPEAYRSFRDGEVIDLAGLRVTVAHGFLRRARGRLFTKDFPMGEGLLLFPCNEIHMLGMKYALDVVFLDRELTVVAVREALPVGTLRCAVDEAYAVLELPVGSADEGWVGRRL